MTDSKPKITPPPHLMLAWQEEARNEVCDVTNHFDRQSIQMLKAASWGWQQRDASVATELQEARDEELKACLEEIRDGAGRVYIDESKLRVCLADDIWTARRPNHKSQAEKALASLDGVPLPEGAWQAVSAALERLRELEEGNG